MKSLRKKLYLIAFLLLTTSQFACAEKTTPPASEKIITITVDDDFEFIKENIKTAITEQGLLVRDVLHISDMLENTKNIGGAGELFAKAEVIEFCSSVITHKMALAHPANISNCPFSISMYALAEKPETLYLSYQPPVILGENNTALEAEIRQMHATIVDAATQ